MQSLLTLVNSTHGRGEVYSMILYI